MDSRRLFTPAEAAHITGVSPEVALAWRKRGIWLERQPEGYEGKHTRYDLEALCVLKLMRTLTEAGIPAGTAAETIADSLVHPLMNAVIAQTKPHISTGYGLIVRKGQRMVRFFSFSLTDIARLGEAHAAPWDTLIVINMASLAKEMVAFGVLD